MEITWGTLALIAIAAGVAWFWQDSLRVRDRANAAAIEACTRLALQFLDGTVAFTRLRLVRDAGQLRLRRTYIFDYTAHSIERLQGFVVLLGMRVESVGFARDPQANAAPPLPPVNGSMPPTNGNVLDLDDWRRNRESRH